MPAGRPTKLTRSLIAEIGEAWLLAFTDEETATLCGISVRTLAYWRKKPEFLQALKRQQFQREKLYRQKIYDGLDGWQGAAWFQERTRPTQFAKPEIQFAVNNNTLNQTVNNTLVVTAEVAGALADRVRPIDARVEKLFKARSTGGNSHPPPAKEI